MPDSQDRLTALEEQVAALHERIRALEGRISREAPSLPSPLNLLQTAALPQSQRPPQEETAMQGTLTYGGIVHIAGRPYQIQRQQAVASVFETAPEALAEVFGALASPHRVIMLRILCQGPRTSQQLQEQLGMSSAGQLYHHLKELQGVGLIVQRGGSAYSIDPAKLITICAALMVASHLTIFSDRGEEPHQKTEGHERT